MVVEQASGNKTVTPIEMINCNILFALRRQKENPVAEEFSSHSRFQSDDREFLCPYTDSLIIGGEAFSEVFKYIEVKVRGCNLGPTECFSMDGLLNYKVNLYLQSSYVDFDEFKAEKMIKHSSNSKTFTVLDIYMAMKQNIYLMKNTIELEDS